MLQLCTLSSFRDPFNLQLPQLASAREYGCQQILSEAKGRNALYVDDDASESGDKNAVAENEAGIGTTKGPLTLLKRYSFRRWSHIR